jgi:hypothetical protein
MVPYDYYLVSGSTGRVKLLGHFWSESCIIPAQMMRNKLNFDNQQKKIQNFDVPLRTSSFSEWSEIEQFRLF